MPNRLLQSVILSLCVLPSSASSQPVGFERPMMGTRVVVTLSGVDHDRAGSYAREAFDEMQRLASLLSGWSQQSEVSRVNARAGREPVRVDIALVDVLHLALTIAERTGGAFDPTWAPLATLGPDSPVAERRTRRLQVGWFRVSLDTAERTVRFKHSGVAIGLGGIAKGYIADAGAQVLRDRGIQNFVVDAGGDLVVSGQRAEGMPWRLAIPHPSQPQAALGRVHITHGAIGTSGAARRPEPPDPHVVIDPKSGAHADATLSVTVHAPTAALADALATAVQVLGPDKGRQILGEFDRTGSGVAGIIVAPDGRIIRSPGADRYFTLTSDRITVTP